MEENVGKTRSLKPINHVTDSEVISDFIEKTIFEFTPDEWIDALAVYDFLAFRAHRKELESALFEMHSETMLERADQTKLNEARERAGIKNAFDSQRLGRSLVKPEFGDI